MREEYIHIKCDRCSEELSQIAKKDLPAEPSEPGPSPAKALYIQTNFESGADAKPAEHGLDSLCDRCKKDVAVLIGRIMTLVRTRETKKEGEPDAGQQPG